MRLPQGKVAVITGGSSRSGAALARRFAREGMKVVMADANRPRVDALVPEFTRTDAANIARAMAGGPAKAGSAGRTPLRRRADANVAPTSAARH